MCEYYHLDESIFVACEQLGYNILDSVRIGRSAIKAEVTPAKYKEYIEAYEDEDIANTQLGMYNEKKEK